MLDLSTICHECGGKVHTPSSTRWPLCAACEHDPERVKRRERRRELRRCQLARIRAWRNGVNGKYYPRDVARLKRRQDGKCVYCGRPLILFHVDHKIPLSRCREMGMVNGNSARSGNLQLLCVECNTAKGGLTDEEYRARLTGD